MALQVTVISATGLPNVETFGKLDPYASVEFQGSKKKTQVKKNQLEPKWNETLDFDLKEVALTPDDELIITVKDWERIGRNKVVGNANISLRSLLKGGSQSMQLDVTLNDSNKRPLQSKVNVKINYNPPAGQKSSSKTVAGEGTVVEQEDDEEEEMDEEVTEVVDPTTGEVKKITHKKKAKRRKFRGKLSNKKQDFQIRIKVLEARQLQGSNIQPVARVTVYNQTRQTRVKKSTNSPFWNESFFFNFNMSPSELFDELIEFQVFNSRKLRSDSLIGSFKMDIGMVYDEQQHSFISKWLLLCDPDDNMAGCKGYLKMCAIVLGPGDQSPSLKAASQDDSEDIESNLLRPAGVSLQPATFNMKLYKAEDLPRMDSAFMQGVKKFIGIGEEQKELVDPYFIFSFAGKEVRSKTMYCSDHPEWNQELRLGLQFPSMCERIKFMICDWDRVSNDDTICSGFLKSTLISAPGENGFLPTFGPCFINFYGSTREYSDLPDEFDDLNLGKGEGVAYRGRALVELKSVLGDLPEVDVADIVDDDLLRVQKFLRRRKYKLHAAFLNATMVGAVDAPVEFEVSIGNYGNKLDENTAPSASTTQPTNAVFDGCHYYFLPWGGTKPCTVVDSHWEDISFRLEALNLLLQIVDHLESNIERVRIGMKAKLPVPELAQLLMSLMDELIQDCRKPIPKPEPGYHVENDLDKFLRSYREMEMKEIINQLLKLKEVATDINETLSDVDGLLQRVKNLAIEPQNSMPDVVIWMISGEKRLAYYRIPANEVLFSKNSAYIGKNCGKLQSIQMKYPGLKAEKEKWEIPALLRIKIWLGLKNQEAEWHTMQTEGELAVFAETYENQVSILGSWTDRGPTMTRPKFSDSQGNVSLPKNSFVVPHGWRWDSDWKISQELSLMFDKDAGHRTFLEDVYENHSRIPAGNWGLSSGRPWTSVKGDPVLSKDEVKLPEGWNWTDDWRVDLGRAVDEEGWEYCVEATMGGYGPVEKTYHLCRRRRWVKSRTLVMDSKRKAAQHKQEKAVAEGWEYAQFFNMKFHAKERKLDCVRRRRWHRKMVAEEHGAPCFFSMKTDDSEEAKAALTAPRMFLTFDKANRYQLRAYIYQARDLFAADDTGLSDPFARVSFLTHSMVTEKEKKTLCPTWDQTLIFEQIEIHSNPKNVEAQPPDIYIELFDYDTFGKAEFLGRTKANPMVKLDPSDARTPVLQWYDIKKSNSITGELLAAFELFLLTGKDDLPFLPPKRGNLFLVPNGIRPVLQRTGVELLCWGVRNMKKFQLSDVSSPSIEFECGGHMVQSSVIKNTKKNPNFMEPLLFLDVMLPKEELYMPPMNIRVKDHRQFGRKPTVGVHILKSLEQFRCQHLQASEVDDESQVETVGNAFDGDHIIDMPSDEPNPKESDLLDLEIDWWSKYYASIGETNKCRKYVEKGLDKLVVHNTELEKAENFSDFSDFCLSFQLMRGKDNDDGDSNVIGEFKGIFKVYVLPQDPNEEMPPKILSSLPGSDPEVCIVRVYIIKAIDLQPNDPTGLADPYVEIILGKKKLNSRDDYVPNTINPVFGRMFEMKTVLPLCKDLTVRVKDYDLLSTDDVIGETVIDLENRYLTKFRAMCGLPKTYCTSGINTWRDIQKPKEILDAYCQKNNIAVPVFYGNNGVKVGSRVYNLGDFEKSSYTNQHLGPPEERLALHVLNTFPLVKEHVETRPLFNPLQPGIEQGKIQMWVDIFPESLGTAGPPFNISPRKPTKYILRIVIWNTVDVVLEEESITGEKMSDIYVVGWISGVDEKQETDVHYRSLDGEGNFNWRYVFPLDYLPAEQMMVVKKKEHFWSLDETEQHLAPILMIQIWDNDKFSADDFLGTVELNLNSMPLPSKKASSCKLSQLPDINRGDLVKTVSLFEQRRIRGFWPCYNDEGGERKLTGKVEMEMELVTEEESLLKPAALGREEPNDNPKLDPPKRPETSFLWFTSPFKTLKFIIWRNYKWYIIGLLIFILFILLIALFIYSFPGELSAAIVGH